MKIPKYSFGILAILVVALVSIVSINNEALFGYFQSGSLSSRAPSKIPTTSVASKITPVCPGLRMLDTLVLVDTNSFTISDNEIKDYFAYASKYLTERTCTKFNIIGIKTISPQTDAEVDAAVYSTLSQNSTLTKKAQYLVLFTQHAECARTNGGCAWSLVPSINAIGITDYCNKYADATQKTNFLYGAIIDWGHQYAKCGYDENGSHISNISLADGSCKNTPGVQCVQKNGYYMCENAVNDYLAADIKLMTVHIILHELMHNFGTEVDGNKDHTVGSQACKDAFAAQNYTFKFTCPTNQDLGDCFFNICQYAWVNFAKAKNLCGTNN